MRKIKTIKVNWNNLKSIQDAEKNKMNLENLGYKLFQTRVGLSTSEDYFVKTS